MGGGDAGGKTEYKYLTLEKEKNITTMVLKINL